MWHVCDAESRDHDGKDEKSRDGKEHEKGDDKSQNGPGEKQSEDTVQHNENTDMTKDNGEQLDSAAGETSKMDVDAIQENGVGAGGDGDSMVTSSGSMLHTQGDS